AEAEWLEKATGILRDGGHRQITALDGFQPEEAYLAAAREAGPALIVMAMGMPKQERLAARLKTDLAAQGVPAVIVNGGAIVDFIAGKVIRAPAWIRSIGMEWAYRLAQEPARLAERYLIGNVTFLLRTARFQALRRPDKAA
ncbi:MAG: WecB/TagA/CpsF family glycosyltransferase, partial [Pseudomonadota bacterium]